MKDAILSAAMQLANLKGYGNVTRGEIAKRARVAAGSVSYHFKDMKGLQAAMVAKAIESKNLKVLGQALARRHPAALKAPASLRQAAALHIAGE